MIDLDGIRKRDTLAYLPSPYPINPEGSIADRRALLAYVDELQRANDAMREAIRLFFDAYDGGSVDEVALTLEILRAALDRTP